MQETTPFLWFDDNAAEAVNFYTAIFKNSRTVHVALNGGQHYTFSPAISFLVNCETRTEEDELWEKLSEGGKIEQCGWLKDKHGMSWQIVPNVLGEMLQDKDSKKSEKVMEALLQMNKIGIKVLREAHEQQ